MLIEKDMKNTRTSKSRKGTKGFSRRRSSLNNSKWLGSEAESLLKAGKAVVIKIDGLKEGEMLKIYPDSKKEIIRLDEQYNEVVVESL